LFDFEKCGETKEKQFSTNNPLHQTSLYSLNQTFPKSQTLEKMTDTRTDVILAIVSLQQRFP